MIPRFKPDTDLTCSACGHSTAITSLAEVGRSISGDPCCKVDLVCFQCVRERNLWAFVHVEHFSRRNPGIELIWRTVYAQ